MKWILWYLKGTVDVGLIFNKTGGLNGYAIRFMDSNYASDHEKRRSPTGYVFILGSWKATLQTTVSLYTTKDDYMAAIRM